MKKYILILLASLCFASCSDFLTEAPVTSQSTDLTLSTYDGLDEATGAAYGYLASSAWYGVNHVFAWEMMTANGRKNYGSQWDTGRYTQWYEHNLSSSYTSSIWSYGYVMISALNNVMDNLEGKGDEQDLNNLRAECLFLRALAHFDLVRTFAHDYSYTSDASHPGVPIILHTDPADRSPRATVAEVYEQIVADLLEAERIIDPSYARSGVADSRAVVTIEVIQALLARVYVYCQNWEGATEYATKVIESGKYEMWDVADMRNAACYTADLGTGEVIFEIYQNTSNSYGGSFNENMSGMTDVDGYGDCCASEELIASYSPSDVRGTLFYSATDGNLGTECYWTTKYSGKGVTDPDVNNFIVLRLSEMYLIRAEAALHGATAFAGSAAADLNMVRTHRGLEAISAPSLTDVYNERALEFAWEGHLWFDLKRTGRNMTRTVPSGYTAPATLAAGADHWAMAIPESELQMNSNLVQNPGY